MKGIVFLVGKFVCLFVCSFVSISTLNISSHLLLACKVSAEKSVDELSGESYNSVSLGSVSGDLMCSFVWNIFADSSFCLNFCVGICTLHKASTPPSLHGLALYRRRPPPISPVRNSVGFYQLFHPSREKQAAVVFVYSTLC